MAPNRIHVDGPGRKRVGEVDYEAPPIWDYLQPAAPVDNVFKLESVLGLFSNVLVAATYLHENNQLLNRDLVFRALRLVIEKHPSLYVLSVPKPSTKKEGHHRAWLARLGSIDLVRCTSFIDDYDDSPAGMQALFQKTHNEWFDLEDRRRPLWKVIVVNRVHVLFVWHHLVCDGAGGIAFHKSFLAALNQATEELHVRGSGYALEVVSSSKKPLPTDALILFRARGYKSNFFATVWGALKLVIFRFWHGRRNFFFNDAIYTTAIPALDHVKDEDFCITSTQSIRLKPITLKKCLAACKENGTTFTSFLATTIDITLATDIYPLSKARILNRQINLRRFVPQPDDDIMNLTTAVARVGRVDPYRNVTPNSKAFWDLAREDKRWLEDCLAASEGQTPRPIQDAMLSAPEDEEAFAKQILPNIKIMGENSYSISNLGAVNSNFGNVDEQKPWGLAGVEFSGAATKSSVGWLLYFGVLSMKGGECVINVCYEKGVLKDERVTEILESIEGRLIAMFED